MNKKNLTFECSIMIIHQKPRINVVPKLRKLRTKCVPKFFDDFNDSFLSLIQENNEPLTFFNGLQYQYLV